MRTLPLRCAPTAGCQGALSLCECITLTKPGPEPGEHIDCHIKYICDIAFTGASEHGKDQERIAAAAETLSPAKAIDSGTRSPMVTHKANSTCSVPCIKHHLCHNLEHTSVLATPHLSSPQMVPEGWCIAVQSSGGHSATCPAFYTVRTKLVRSLPQCASGRHPACLYQGYVVCARALTLHTCKKMRMQHAKPADSNLAAARVH